MMKTGMFHEKEESTEAVGAVDPLCSSLFACSPRYFVILRQALFARRRI